MRAHEVTPGPTELGGRDALLAKSVQHVELEGEARRRVGRFRKGPQTERLTATIVGQARIRAVRPAAFRPYLLHQPSREGSAERRVRDDEREVIRICRMRTEAADEDLGLRAFGLVDEHE